MKTRLQLIVMLALSLTTLCCAEPDGYGLNGKTIDHNHTAIGSIPVSAIITAKSSLSIYYGHTSHGSQLISGMSGLDAFKGGTGLYTFNSSGSGGALRIVEAGSDAGYYPAWRDLTVDYLGAANSSGRGSTHPEVNVVMWSWCGQLSSMATATLQSNYLDPMETLEMTYPGITFVYFTGHLDGTGTNGTLNRNNEMIRDWCASGDRWLYDFADIETYDPDGKYFGDMYPTDACNYDFNASSGTTQTTDDPAQPTGGDRNWALDWQSANPGKWYNCSPAHTQAVNGNLKAYAAWWLFARIAGWTM